MLHRRWSGHRVRENVPFSIGVPAPFRHRSSSAVGSRRDNRALRGRARCRHDGDLPCGPPDPGPVIGPDGTELFARQSPGRKTSLRPTTSPGSPCAAVRPRSHPRARDREAVVVEPRGDPAKQAQTRPPAPAVGVTVAREEPCCLFRSADQGEHHVADREREQKPVHQVKVALASRR
jgi:hypothetical protein